MATFNPNPNAEANLAFDIIQPGVYRMRIAGSGEAEAIKPFTSQSGNQCLRIRFEFVDVGSLVKLDGTPALNAGALFDSGIVTYPEDKQGKLRSLVEACGFEWGQISDTDALVGCELDVKVGLGEYQGEQKNEVKRYLKAA